MLSFRNSLKTKSIVSANINIDSKVENSRNTFKFRSVCFSFSSEYKYIFKKGIFIHIFHVSTMNTKRRNSRGAAFVLLQTQTIKYKSDTLWKFLLSNSGYVGAFWKNTQHGSQIIFRFLRHHIKDTNYKQMYHYSLPVVIYLLHLVLDKWIGQLQNKITDLKRSLWRKQDDQTFPFVL